MSKELIQFAKTFLEFTPTSIQERFMNYLASYSKPNVSVAKIYSKEKERIANEFACNKLTLMLTGELFILVTPLGKFTFKLESIQPYKEVEGINPSEAIIDEGGE